MRIAHEKVCRPDAHMRHARHEMVPNKDRKSDNETFFKNKQ